MIGYFKLRTEIIGLINAEITAGRLPNIKRAYWEFAAITGTPAVIIMPETSESERQSTTGTRERIFEFRMLVIREISEKEAKKAEEVVSLAIDELITLFDKPNVLTIVEPDQELLTIEPIPSSWDFMDIKNNINRVGTLIIRCKVMRH